MIMGEQAIHFRHLLAMGRSAAHARHALDGGEDDETYAMERGTAVHALLFGTRKVIGYPGKTRQGKAWEEFQAEHSGTEILTGREYEKAARMAEAVRKDPLAMAVLAGRMEKTISWTWLGRKCEGTPDVQALKHVAELKTTMCADPVRFAWQSRRMGYHAAMAWYKQGIELAGIAKPEKAFIVAVESKAPYPVTTLELTRRALEAGERQLRLWMERMIGCLLDGVWPPYAQAIVPLDLPEDELVLDYGDEEAA